MRINIINLDKEGWILTKFAKRMNLQLNELGHTSFLTKSPRTDVDVNHSIIFLFLHKDIDFFPPNTINTTMLTHVNDDFRYKKIRSIASYLNAGIAMSKDHSKFIKHKRLGLKKIFHVLPPHDNDLDLKKIHFGIFTNLYSDGRKHESFFLETISKLDPQLVKFSIIGKGWSEIIKKLQKKNLK